MTREEAIAKLRALRPELEALGFRHVWLFGSVARDEAGPDSDVDLLVDVPEEVYENVWHRATFQLEVEPDVAKLVGRRTDVIDRAAARQRFLDRIEDDLVRVF